MAKRRLGSAGGWGSWPGVQIAARLVMGLVSVAALSSAGCQSMSRTGLEGVLETGDAANGRSPSDILRADARPADDAGLPDLASLIDVGTAYPIGEDVAAAMQPTSDGLSPPVADAAPPHLDVPSAPDVTLPDVAPPDVPTTPSDALATLPLGEVCASAAECASGSCVDGVCCDSTCTGSCGACNVPGDLGTCMPVTGSPRGTRAACAGAGSTCGGACDGEHTMCTFPSADTECAPARCANGTATTPAICNGSGSCLPGTNVTCMPFTCDGAICAGGCSATLPCTAGNFCDGGRCAPQKASGSTCQTGAACTSGNCVDGRCCGTATCGTCEACTGAGGTCAKIVSMEDAGTCGGEQTCSAAGTCLKKSGQTCSVAPACISGNCADGRCCTVASCGACSTCTGAGGTCTRLIGSRWVKLPNLALDIDVNASGATWVLGIDKLPGGFGIYRWTGTAWMNVPGAAGTRIAVGPDGVAWVTTATQTIYRRIGDTWQLVPGTATDIDIGPDGTVWVVGTTAGPGGHIINRWDGTAWQPSDGGGERIAVGPGGIPWVVTDTGLIRRRDPSGWVTMSGTAREIDVSASGVPWIIGNNAVAGGHGIFRWSGSNWEMVPGGAEQIGVGSCMAWVINDETAISRRE